MKRSPSFLHILHGSFLWRVVTATAREGWPDGDASGGCMLYMWSFDSRGNRCLGDLPLALNGVVAFTLSSGGLKQSGGNSAQETSIAGFRYYKLCSGPATRGDTLGILPGGLV